MSKIKIYELAKELDKPSKELVEFLNKKDVEAKTHMSTIDEAEADMVRKAFAPKANAEKAEEEKGLTAHICLNSFNSLTPLIPISYIE